MRLRNLRYIAPLVGLAAAASIIAAPTAMAASTDPNCTYLNGTLNTQCDSPGNTQINDSPPVTFGTQYPYWEGDEWGGGYGHYHGGHR
jgi:hypothetical protein